MEKELLADIENIYENLINDKVFIDSCISDLIETLSDIDFSDGKTAEVQEQIFVVLNKKIQSLQDIPARKIARLQYKYLKEMLELDFDSYVDLSVKLSRKINSLNTTFLNTLSMVTNPKINAFLENIMTEANCPIYDLNSKKLIN